MDIVTAAGSFLLVGASVGEATREDVRHVIEAIVPEVRSTAYGGDKAAFAKAVDGMAGPAEAFFPEAMQYMRGLAKGAGVDILDLLAVLFSEEMAVAPVMPRAEKCSTLVVRTDEGWVLGHNEDFWPSFLGRMAVLDLRFDDYPRTVSLNYPGHLPHIAGSLNEAGVAVANNSLWPAATPGLSKQFKHCRATLSRTMDEAVSALRGGPQSLTDHYTVISAKEDLARSLEVSHLQVSESECESREIGDEPFCHTNSVLYLPLREADPNPAAGCRRLAALRAIGKARPPGSPEDMLDALALKDGVLNRGPGNDLLDRPSSVTLATVIVMPLTGEFFCRQYGKETDAYVVL